MCGRYLLRAAPEDATHPPWSEYWHDINVTARFNICPSQTCLVIRNVDKKPRFDFLSWGFKPSWSKYSPSINARSEGLASSKMFKGAFRHQRCLVVADGFYEPKGPSQNKNRPWYLFEFADQSTFAIAGIWTQEGFAIITCGANQQVSPIHDRMPLIIEKQHWRAWLDYQLHDELELSYLLKSRDYPELSARPVSNFVKKAGNEGKKCIEAM